MATFLFNSVALLIFFQPALDEDGISAERLRELRATSVFIKVEGKGWGKSGSGFLVQSDKDASYVVTNNHVIELPFQTTDPEERQVHFTFAFNSGTDRERVVKGNCSVIFSDPKRDLAIIRVGAKDLPKPLDMTKSAVVEDSMPIYSLGFPLGSQKAKKPNTNPEVTVFKGSVTKVREDDDGRLGTIKLAAGLQPGSSGGAIVDRHGLLVGVAQAGIPNTPVNFAIHAAFLFEALNARLMSIDFETMQADDRNAQIELKLGFRDPIGKLKSVTLNYLPAEKYTRMKADRNGIWQQLPGADHMDCRTEAKVFRAKMTVPTAGRKKAAFVFQPVCVQDDGKTIVGAPATHWLNLEKAAKTWLYIDLERTSAIRNGVTWSRIEPERTTRAIPKAVSCVSMSPDGKRVAYAWSEKNRARVAIWRPSDGSTMVMEEKNEVADLKFTPDGKTVLVITRNQTVRIWNTEAAEEVAAIDMQGPARTLAFSSDGKKFVAVVNQTVQTWDWQTLGREDTKNLASTWRGVFSPDLQTCAAVTSGTLSGPPAVIELFDLKTGKSKAVLRGHKSSVLSMAFSPDGKRLATGGHDGAIICWDTLTGETLANLSTQDRFIKGLLFRPNGRLLSVGPQSVRLWDLSIGKELASQQRKIGIFQAALDSQGTTLVLGLADGRIELIPVSDDSIGERKENR